MIIDSRHLGVERGQRAGGPNLNKGPARISDGLPQMDSVNLYPNTIRSTSIV